MGHENIALFQEIWEQTNDEQGEASLLNIKRYFRHCEDIDMGWINMQRLLLLPHTPKKGRT
jgi:hypothetical protein